jgi:hypothetical protein
VPTEASHLGHRHPGDAQFAQGISYFLELVGFDYCFDHFHAGRFTAAWPLALTVPSARSMISAAKSPDFAGSFAQERSLRGRRMCRDLRSSDSFRQH